ncbi:MAG TPA: hypothetical protein VNW52_12020 [Burkholderiaceae bacterium]|nr:hypothetical protein [Burkholderiaceae bacterium]
MAHTVNLTKRVLLPLLFVAAGFCCTVDAVAGESENLGGSEKVSIGTMSILVAPAVSVGGSADGQPVAGASVAAAGSAFIVTGVAQGAGNSVEVMLEAVGAAGKLSVQLSKSAVQTLALSVGTTVRVISETTGTILVASGKVIAFIPNELGQALLSQARLPAR